ncbi:PHP domain-containing protein [Ruminococcus sp.]|uniref:PHP domain-containing protein n=1 Tax=Ruminococcus sp. TaxID=41978 RepID=UPI0025D0B47A|nr:PHP domain-containing protein [Ruminococcus sp.]MBQ8966307.1 PHP domain-containing protein [Ruminococcus sp.]
MYKYETHLHTAETSACASATGAEQARRYKEEGYDGIFVTDHFFNSNTTVPRDLPWKERVDLYCKGYENARAEGDRIGLKVFFGIEYTYDGADILVYGLDKQWLCDHPDCDKDFFRFHDDARASGALLIHAHPFRQADYLRGVIKLLPRWVDGVEVYNSGNGEESWNEEAEWYAKTFGFRVTAGTDNHHLSVEQDRLAGVMSEVEISGGADYKAAFLSDKITPLYPKRRLG